MSLPALDADDFQLFGLPPRQAQDRARDDRPRNDRPRDDRPRDGGGGGSRGRQADPNSPFAALAALKADLERRAKER